MLGRAAERRVERATSRVLVRATKLRAIVLVAASLRRIGRARSQSALLRIADRDK
jgi:hypothetical protein